MVERGGGDFAAIRRAIWTTTPSRLNAGCGNPPRGLGALAKPCRWTYVAKTPHGWAETRLVGKTPGSNNARLNGRQHPTADQRQVRFWPVVRHGIGDIGEITAENAGEPTPVLDAMFARKELKSVPDGTISWSVDISNPQTGDDFVLFIKEPDT